MDFCPISICNEIYKILSKLLVRRLKTVFLNCIGQEQSAFIEGRQIIDNAIIAFECFKAIKKKKGKDNWCALKFDISKAFDSLEWGHIITIMRELGFSDQWCNIIQKCLSSSPFFNNA